jgi:hypothetical protein
MWESVKAECSNKLNELNEPVALLEGICSIHLECHQLHRPFAVSGNLLISVSHMVLFFQGVLIVNSFE